MSKSHAEIMAKVDEANARYIERVKDSPNFCKVYARRTPPIPFHNGWYRSGDICLGCRKVKP